MIIPQMTEAELLARNEEIRKEIHETEIYNLLK